MVSALTFNQISKAYGAKKPALQDVTFQVNEGEFFGLLGLNGAGKTTLIRVLSLLTPPDSGSVACFGVDNIFSDPASVKLNFGLMPQEINLSPFLTPKEILETQGRCYGIEPAKRDQRIDWLLRQLNLREKKNVPVSALSGGMKRTLMLARALIHYPKLLILDEPGSGIDIETREAIWEFLKALNRAGMTMILTSHYLEEMESLCSSIGVLHKGKFLFKEQLNKLQKRMTATQVWELRVQKRKEAEPLNGAVWLSEDRLLFPVAKLATVTSVALHLHSLGYEVCQVIAQSNQLESILSELKLLTKQEKNCDAEQPLSVFPG